VGFDGNRLALGFVTKDVENEGLFAGGDIGDRERAALTAHGPEPGSFNGDLDVSDALTRRSLGYHASDATGALTLGQVCCADKNRKSGKDRDAPTKVSHNYPRWG
jgi:hypothetical protein